MRLALVTQHYAPHFEGGTEAVVRAQARAFAERGDEVLVVAGTDRPWDGQDVVPVRVDGVEVRHLPRHPDEAYDLRIERPRLRALVQELVAGHDLVHLHHWSTLDSRLVRTLAPTIPVVVTLHDLFTTCPRVFRLPAHGVEACGGPGDFGPCVPCIMPDAGGLSAAELGEGLAGRMRDFAAELRAAALVVSPSASHLERVVAHAPLPLERTAVVPHGLSRALGAVRGAGDASQGVVLEARAGEGLRIGSFGHRARAKGTLDLVEAVAGLPAELRRRVTLVLFGEEVEPGLDAAMQALVARAADEGGAFELRLETSYAIEELPGRVRDLGGLHFAAQPSRAWESYGLVVDEALAMGLPVWVADRGAPRERVGEAGRVLPAATPAAWTAALAEVLGDHTRLERERRAVPTDLPTAADAMRALAAHFEALLEGAR